MEVKIGLSPQGRNISRVSEQGVGPMRKELTGENGEMHNLYSSTNVIIKSKSVRLVKL